MTKDIKVIVLEMNNSIGKIMGAGCVLNRHRYDCPTRIYSDINYNRYIYRSNHRIDRVQIDPKLLTFLEHLVFKEKSHMKRGQGITIIGKNDQIYCKILQYHILRDLKNGILKKDIIKKYRDFKHRLGIFIKRFNSRLDSPK